jgi:hypothetical protein
MTPDPAEVSRRLRTHPRWIALGIYTPAYEHRSPEGALDHRGLLDLDDDANAGILLGLLRDIARETGRSGPHVSGPGPSEHAWGVEIGDDDRGPDDPLILGANGRTLAEAAARVLLAAWEDQ